MRFLTFEQTQNRLRDKTIAIVGSAPSVLKNASSWIDGHEVVVRVNNYKLGASAGFRTDVFYSFFGQSIRKTRAELKHDGVWLCMCKCPNSKPISCEWHERNGKLLGIDFRYIYKAREEWWFCDTYVPTDAWFRQTFELLERHVPTTGFAAILDVLSCEPKHVYLTGFDFFSSGVHNVDEKWRPGDPQDPIGHRPDLELDWLCRNSEKFIFDEALTELVASRQRHLVSA